MNPHKLFRLVAAPLFLLGIAAGGAERDPSRLPNIVIIFTDDQGYADVGVFGAKGFKTPNLDRMAREGIRFTDFHVAQPVCSASRAALLTGCYPNRVGIHGALGPASPIGLHPDETTLAELVKQKGYATAMFGKWHLGRPAPLLPVRQGFDQYFGLPYSNDMWPFHPEAKPGTYPPLPLIEGDQVLRDGLTSEDQTHLTTWYTERAVKFIEQNRARPFFLYLAHNMPHVPLHVSDRFKGKSRQGAYGDVIMEIDWSVGQVLEAIKTNGLDTNTLVIFTSDNGPWLSYGDHAGSARPLREGKGTSWEGGTRVPFVARWPSVIPAGKVCKEMAMTIDLFPTIAGLIGAALPDRKIDGLDIWPLLSGDPKAKNPHEAYFFYYANNELQAVRQGQWKLILPHTYRTLTGQPRAAGGIPAKYQPVKLTASELYDLRKDPQERQNVAAKLPDVVRRLETLAERCRDDLGDSLTGRKGAGVRPPGREPPSAKTDASAAPPRKTSDQSLAGRRPNVILILTDDQGYGDLSCHGNPVLKTPNLDRLHAEGRRFTDFQVSPTCSPTRSSLLTGRHEFKSGVTHTIQERERLSLHAVTLPQVLKSAGYTTAIFGKWHLGDEPDRWPDKRGFDEMFIHGAGGIGQSYPGSCGDAPGNKYFDPVILHNGKFEKAKGYCTDVFFGQALRWIEQQAGKQPFFAYITPNAPHAPLDCPADYEKLYAGRVPTNVAQFFGMIANIDDNVGRLLAMLKSRDLERNTLVLFMNDNGGTAGVRVHNAGMRAGKGTPYYGGVRAASFWRWPGVLPPGDVPELAAHVDVFPTLAAIAGAGLPADVATRFDGRSLVPLLEDPSAPWPERFLVTHVGRWERGQAEQSKYRACSIRNERYQLVSNAKDGARRWELYDLKADPGQTRDLLAERSDAAARLEAAYDRWWEEVLPCLENENATGPAVNPFKALYWKQFGGGPATRDGAP